MRTQSASVARQAQPGHTLAILILFVCTVIQSVVVHAQTGQSWYQVPRFTGCKNAALLEYHGKMWLIGGNAANPRNDVWSSSDGTNWTEVLAAAPWGPSYTAPVGLVFQDKLWILNGSATPPTSPGASTAAWSSTDGRHWERSPALVPWIWQTAVCAAVHQGKAYVYAIDKADHGLNTGFIYSSSDGQTWTTETETASFFGALRGCAMVSFRDSLWILGGHSETNRFYPAYTNQVWTSSDGKTWMPKTSNSPTWAARAGASCLVRDGRLWLFGGMSEIKPKDKTAYNVYYNDVWSTDYGAWTQESAISQWSMRAYAASVMFQDKFWLVGGQSSSSDCNDVWCSTEGTNWQEVPASGWPIRQGQTTVVFQGKLWNLGGKVPGKSYVDAAGEVWNSSDGTSWTCVSGNAPWGGRTGHASVVFKDRLWVLGGMKSNTEGFYCVNDVWSSPDGRTWTRETDSALWRGRSNHAAVVFGDKIWVLGGNIGGAQINDIYSSPDGKNWTCETFTAPWRARESHAALVFNQKLWVMGGTVPDVWSSTDGTSWTQLVPTPNWGDRQFPTGVVARDKMWIIGGLKMHSDGGGPSRIDVWSSGDGEHWDQVTDQAMLTIPTETYSTAYFRDKFWVMGAVGQSNSGALLTTGILQSENGRDWSATATRQWSGRLDHTALVHHGKLWILGGYGSFNWPIQEDQRPRNDVFCLDGGTSPTLVTDQVPWPARCDHTSLSFAGKMWILGGGHYPLSLYSGTLRQPMSDVWSSAEGTSWTQVTAAAPWGPRSGHSSVVFHDRMWVIAGAQGQYSIPSADAWSSADGSEWRQETTQAPWCGRFGQTCLVFNDRIWLLGGMNFDRTGGGGSTPLNDVWSSPDGIHWTQELDSAPWPARHGFTGLVYQEKMWVIGGSSEIGCGTTSFADMWSSSDGRHWTQSTDPIPWLPRGDQAGAVYRNALWLIGGSTDPTGPSFTNAAEIWHTQASVAILSPSGGSLQSGSVIQIHWRTDENVAGTALRLELWNSQGRLADLGKTWNPDGEGVADVYLPFVPDGSDYRIRAVSIWDPTLSAESDEPFTLLGNPIHVQALGADKSWPAGSTQMVWWQVDAKSAGNLVRFELWRRGVKVADLGVFYTDGGEAVTAVPVATVAPGSDYRLRAVSMWNPTLFADSTETITIGDGRNGLAPQEWMLYR